MKTTDPCLSLLNFEKNFERERERDRDRHRERETEKEREREREGERNFTPVKVLNKTFPNIKPYEREAFNVILKEDQC